MMEEPEKKLFGYSILLVVGIICLCNEIAYINSFSRADFVIAGLNIVAFCFNLYNFLRIKDRLYEYYN